MKHLVHGLLFQENILIVIPTMQWRLSCHVWNGQVEQSKKVTSSEESLFKGFKAGKNSASKDCATENWCQET